MITINIPHVCKLCKAPIPTWSFGKYSKVKQIVQKRSVWPLKEEPTEFDFAEYSCPYCKYKGRGKVVIANIFGTDNALLDVKEI